MYYKKDFENTKSMFEKWWRKENERPLFWIIAKKEKYNNKYQIKEFKTNKDIYLDYETKTNNFLNFLENHEFLCESYPNISGDLGPGSLAIYIGSSPIFSSDTVWFKEIIKNIDKNLHFKTNINNKWFKIHLEMIKNLRKLSKNRYMVNIPDLVENIDIYSAMRGPENTCFDLMDCPEYVKEKIEEIDNAYFHYYDKFYEEAVLDGYSSFTAFSILGKGKVAKLQCDFSSMISPGQYREFVVPSMNRQLEGLDRSIYHLDGKDAIKHLDAVMEYEKLDALQWTPGANYPDGASEKWYEIYDKVKAGNKGLWITVYDGNIDDWIKSTKKMVNRYGNQGLYFLYPVMKLEEAKRLMDEMGV